jgi:hypothetical protein
VCVCVCVCVFVFCCSENGRDGWMQGDRCVVEVALLDGLSM